MDWFKNTVTGAANSVTGETGQANGGMFSNLFGAKQEEPAKVDENGVPIKIQKLEGDVGVIGGGRRKRKSKRQCGGSFHPYTPSSNLASTASSFKGGRRRKSRKSYKKKSRRKSYRKRR